MQALGWGRGLGCRLWEGVWGWAGAEGRGAGVRTVAADEGFGVWEGLRAKVGVWGVRALSGAGNGGAGVWEGLRARAEVWGDEGSGWDWG